MSMGNEGLSHDEIRANTRIDCSKDKGKTKQSFAKECDINNIMSRYEKTGAMSHLTKYEGRYGDYATSMDLHEYMQEMGKTQDMFDDLPKEIKREFGQDPGKFIDFVQNPENSGRLAELLPALAAPGSQLPALGGEALITAMNGLTEALGPSNDGGDGDAGDA